jgi:hypothetical protein
MNSNSNEPTNYKSQQNDDQSIAHEYLETQIVSSNNYIPNELLHQQHHLPMKSKIDFSQSKDSSMILVYSQSVQDAPQILTNSMTTAKYVDLGHEESQMQMIATNEDSDKSDCETNELHEFKAKHVKRNLPHKKRIAKRIVSDNNQPYNTTQEEHFGMVLADNNMRFPAIASYECSICPNLAFVHQFEFFLHLKKHYEADEQNRAVVVDQKSREIHQEVGENLIINHQSNGNIVPENIMETLDESADDMKGNIPQVIDEFNEFSEPEDMMEDFRKEVEKVVETIGENDCVETSRWFNPDDEIEPQVEQNVDLQIYQIADNVAPQTFDHIPRATNDVVLHQPTPAELKSFDHEDDYDRDDDGDYDDDEENEEDEEDEDDKKTLEQLRKETMEEVSDVILIYMNLIAKH